MKNMSIIVNNSIVFLDSFQFCKGSLDSLAGNLEDSDFKHLLSEFPPNKLEIRIKEKRCMSIWMGRFLWKLLFLFINKRW